MVLFLFVISVVVLSIELSYIGKVMGFFQQKAVITDVWKLIISSGVVFFLLLGGYLLGGLLLYLFGDSSSWYAATVMFVLGLKMFYDGVKTHKVKQQINPHDAKGLFILSVLVGLNAFFIGVSFGLLQLALNSIFISLAILISSVIGGYVYGVSLKKLNSHRFEFLLGIIYVIIAIIEIVKI
jgi:putative Mn2+ efflux pump MntP